MGSYLVVFTVAGIASAISMPMLMALGTRLSALDNTREPPVPRVGGWAVGLGGGAALVLVGVVFVPTGSTLVATVETIGPVMLGAGAILLLGTVDDIFPVPAGFKFLIQVLVALGVIALGVRIEVLSFPLGSLTLGPVFGLAFTVLWLVGITNAFNLLDGADGVAAGSAFFAATAVFIMSVALGNPAGGLVAAALAGALLGFLPFNFPPARSFLGDSGSMLAGFLLAGLAVEGSTKGPTLVAIAVPLVAFAVPVFDTGVAVLRRLVRGQPLFQADHGHVHHRLLQFGYSPRQVAGIIYAASAGCALLAMLFLNPGVRSLAVVLIVVGVATLVVVRFLRLHELNELARLARRGVLQPRSVAMNVQLRRAAERLEGAQELSDLLSALAILFRGSEFDEVMLTVSPPHERRKATLAWRLVDGAFEEGHTDREHDEWELQCPFDGLGWVGTLYLRRRLGRRSLMMDFNLLMEIVQPALENAAGRIVNPIPQAP